MRSSRPMCTRQAVLPTPARAMTTPRLPFPSPPWIDFSRIRNGLCSFTSLAYMGRGSLLLGGGLELLVVLRDELLGDVGGHLEVARKLHRELGLALRRR